MAAYINRIFILIVLILICDIQCDINNDNNGNKLTQSSEKDSKVSQHENDGENKVSLDESGIHVKPKPSHDNLNIKHVSSHDNKRPLESSFSDQGDREASSKSQPIDTSNHAPNIDSPSSIVSPDEISSDKVENDVDPLAVDNGEILFEETGGPEDSLVDQMKLLSEKIKESEKKESVEMKMPDKVKEAKVETDNIEKTADQVHDNVRLDDNFGTKLKPEDTDDEIKMKDFNRENIKDNLNAQNVDLTMKEHKVEQNVEQGNKETIMQQLKKLEKEALEREADIPSLVPSYGNEDLPSEEELEEADKEDNIYNQDILGKSDEQFVGLSSEIVIDNTQPPPSDILPTKTEEHLNEHIKQTTEQIQLRPTPSLENVKSTEHTLSQIDATEQILPTARVDMKSSKKILNAQERKNLRLAKNKKQTDTNADEKQIPTPVKTNVNPTPVHEVNLGTKQPEIVNKEVTAAVDMNAATVPESIKTVTEEIETSDNDITGTVYDTNAFKEAVVQETFTEKTAETGENLSPTKVTEDKVPAVKETLTPHGQDSLTQSQEEIQSSSSSSSSSSETSEETPEEKEKKAQAQQYFEEGEKLINNSYKKDYIQAYEYFHLAADLGHTKALEYLGFGYLLGDYVTLDPAKALKLFQDLSEKGSPKGQLGLGFSYSSGLAVNSSQAKALIYFTFAALGGDPLAQMVLGYRFLSGIGVESKCETALTYYRKVATTVAENTSSGSPVVQRIRLHEQADNKDSGVGSLMDDDLLQYYEFLADKGDVQAQVVLGQLYYQGGRGVPVNHERAQHYFLMASESGNGNAYAFLGKMHSEGSPVIPQDEELALQYFKKAADKGNPIGQCGLGIVHLYGKGVEKDYQKALKYFTQSSDQGWSDAQLHLGIMHFGGKGVRRDYKVAVKYFNLASQGGHVLAFYHLAQMHATGTGVLRNCHTAVELYKNVAERGKWASMLVEAHDLYKNGNINEALLKYTFLAEMGYEVAQTNVAYILDNGESTLFDQTETYQRALLHWTRAASQGSSTVARLKMGDYHYYGYGTDIDYETAATHYRLATEQQHNAQAMFNLGYMHENGLGLKQDVHLAKRFYDMAAETSGDAYVPVTLALFKLGMFYGTDVFNKEMENYYSFFNKLDIRYQLGPYWDIYIATFLAIALGIVVVVFRHQR